MRLERGVVGVAKLRRCADRLESADGRESLGADVYAQFFYAAHGNTRLVDVLGTDGFLFLSNTYAFTRDVKNPHLALHGVPDGK